MCCVVEFIPLANAERFMLRFANVSSMRFFLGCMRYVSKQVLDAAFRKGWSFTFSKPCTSLAGLAWTVGNPACRQRCKRWCVSLPLSLSGMFNCGHVTGIMSHDPLSHLSCVSGEFHRLAERKWAAKCKQSGSCRWWQCARGVMLQSADKRCTVSHVSRFSRQDIEFHGIVKYMSKEKGYGFIECKETHLKQAFCMQPEVEHVHDSKHQLSIHTGV